MRVKRFILIALATAMVFATTACGGAGTSNQETTAEETSQNTGTIEVETEVTTEIPTTAKSTEITSEAIKPGNYVEHDNLKFSFEKAIQYDKIESDYYTAEPEDGKKYLVLFFEVENISDEDQYINIFYSKAYLDDYDIDQTSLLVEPEGYSMLSGDLAPGKKQKGYICYEVNPDWKKLEMTYRDGALNTSPTYDFVVTPDNLS